MDIEHTTSLKSMNGLPTMGQYYSELFLLGHACNLIPSRPSWVISGHPFSFEHILSVGNEAWITEFCVQNIILKRLGDNFHKKCLVFITLPANLIGTQLEMSYRQH